METNLIRLPENLTTTMQGAGTVLSTNKTSVEKATEFGNQILSEIESKGVTEEIYTKGVEYLNKIKKTITKMSEDRKPVTQIISEVSKAFTSLEAMLDPKKSDTVPGKVQQKLDEYATELARKKAEAEKQAQLALAKEKAKTEAKASIERLINEKFVSFMRECLTTLNQKWFSITLDDFDTIRGEIMNYKVAMVFENLSNITYYNSSQYLTNEDIQGFKQAIVTEKFKEYSDTLKEAIRQRVDEISILFESKRAELQEIANANAAEAQRLQEAAKQRELAEQAASEAITQETLKNANANTEVKKNTANVETLFDLAAPATFSAPTIKIKEFTQISVNGGPGWMALLAFYFEKEATSLTADQLEKKFGFAKKFAEAYFDKNGEKINSPYLTYQTSAKAK